MHRPFSGWSATTTPLRRRVRSSLLLLSVSIAVVAGFVGACTGEDAVLTAVTPGDGGANGDVDVDDAGLDAGDRPCDPAKDFDPPVPVGGLATPEYAESTARFSPDERVVYFTRFGYVDASASDFATDIYTASRASTTLGFDAPRLMTELGSDGAKESPTVTADGKGFFFLSLLLPAGVFKTTGKLPPFVSAERLPGPINEGPLTLSPYVLPDGSALYVAKRLTAEPSRGVIHRAARGTGAYDDVQPVTALGPSTDDDYPVVTADELTIYWASQRGGAGTQDIYEATRQDAKSPFSAVRRVDSLSTAARDERPTFISADGCRLYYASSVRVKPPATASDIFVATKPK